MSSIASDEIHKNHHELNLMLEAKDLPKYGSKAEKWARLHSGQVSKKKPGRKGKFDAFSKAQVSDLVALGVDEEQLTQEIKRRWDAMNEANKAKPKSHVKTEVHSAASKTAAMNKPRGMLNSAQQKIADGLALLNAGTSKFQSKADKAKPKSHVKTEVHSAASKMGKFQFDHRLDDDELKSSGLTFVTKMNMWGGKPLFIYEPGAVLDEKVSFADKSAPSKSKTADNKRKRADEEEEDDDDDDDDNDDNN